MSDRSPTGSTDRSPRKPRRPRRRTQGRSDASALAEATRDRLDFAELLERVATLATSTPGKDAVRALTPFDSSEDADGAQAEAEEVRTLMRSRFSFRLDRLEDVRRFLPDPEREGELPRVLEGRELHAIWVLLERSHALGKDLSVRDDLPMLAQRARRLEDRAELRESLERSVDVAGAVLDSASAELATIRASILEIERDLRRWLERRVESREFRRALQDAVVTERNGRFVVPVKAEHRSQVRGVVHAESASGATLFIEPEAIVIRGDELDALRHRERHEVQRVLIELTRAVRSERPFLERTFDELLALDVAFARASFGERFGGTRPHWNEDRRFVLEQARHPLLMDFASTRGAIAPVADEADLERMREAVVPLDLDLSSQCYQVVVTGPNTGGKTVVLKTAGLIVLMASIGLPVTAGRADLPFFRGVYADIGDEQSLEQSLSTFSAHMTVTGEILEHCNSRSLVLLDELGAGTDPLEGAALGQAILEQLYRRGTFALVTTHLGRLKEFAFTHRKCTNASMEFDSDKLAPTYRLQIGLPGKSNALVIARRIGLAPEVVDRAQEVLVGEDRVDERVLEGLERTQRDLDRRRNEVKAKQADMARTEEELSAEREAILRMRRGIEHESERAEEERVRDLAGRIERAIKALGPPSGERRAAYDELLGLLDEARRTTRLSERRLRTAERLKKGDWVFVPRLAQVCEVRKINKGKQLLTVAHGSLPIEVSFDDISWILPPPGYDHAWYDPDRA